MGLEESGYYRQEDWFGKTTGIIVLKDKTEIDRVRVYREALEWMPAIVNTPMIHQFFTGLRAYDAYMEAMRRDDQFPPDDMAILAERKMVHYDAMTMIAERGASSLSTGKRASAESCFCR